MAADYFSTWLDWGSNLKIERGFAMKQKTSLITAIISGLLMLGALFFQTYTAPYLALVLNWLIILSSSALLVGIAGLVVNHLGFILKARKGCLYSVVLLLSFFATIIFGILLGVDNPDFLQGLSAILVPMETALMALIALVLMSAAIKIFRQRGWSILTVSFALSALLFLFLNLGFLRFDSNPALQNFIGVLQGLPTIGARGLLIGVSLGALIMALRVLFGQEASNE